MQRFFGIIRYCLVTERPRRVYEKEEHQGAGRAMERLMGAYGMLSVSTEILPMDTDGVILVIC